MDELFEEAFRKVVALEGGFTIHQNPGEEEITYAGIYRKKFPNWEGWKYIDQGEKPPTELVRSFYYENFYSFWEDKVQDERLRFLAFECSVNVGVERTVRLFQRILGVVEDGVWGPKIQSAFEKANPEILIRDFILARIFFYLELANANPKRYGIFLRGWFNRIKEALT